MNDPLIHPPLLVLGAGAHGRIVAEAATASGVWRVVAFGDDNPAWHGRTLDGLPVGPWQDRPPGEAVVVAVGNNGIRKRLLSEVRMGGRPLATVVHPGAVVSPGARIGAGTVILAGAVVQAGACIGENVIVNAGAVIDHDAVIGEGAHVGLNATVASRATVEPGGVVCPGGVVLAGTGGSGASASGLGVR